MDKVGEQQSQDQEVREDPERSHIWEHSRLHPGAETLKSFG